MEPQRGLLILPCACSCQELRDGGGQKMNPDMNQPVQGMMRQYTSFFFPWLFWKESTNLVAFGVWTCLEVSWPDAEHVLQIKQFVLLQTGSGMTFSSHRIMTNKN